MEQTGLVPRATLAQICAFRDRTLEEYAEAYEAITVAEAAIQKARLTFSTISPGNNRYNHHSSHARKVFLEGIDIPKHDTYMTTARKLVDTEVWSHLIQITDLERLMDKRAKDEFSQQLIKDPPEATLENLIATLKQFLLDSDMIFKRGVAEAFSGLDKRFRSHDGWKIGSRVILTYALDSSGSWSYSSNKRDTLLDIERIFFVLENKQPPPSYAGIMGAIDYARRGHYGPHQSCVETEYLKVRCFQNGNAHVWFKRDDLLERVNQLLGEYYDAPIPEEREPEDDGGLFTPKTAVAKNFAFYPTPTAAAETLIEKAMLYRREGDPVLTALEPSAGTGNLAYRCVDKGAIVDCVEIQPELAAGLERTGKYRKVLNVDFLDLQPDPENLFDRVVMNPAFDRERDIDHVMHAMKFLRPDGMLIAIMSAGTEFRETRKSVAFREHIKKMGGRFDDLPAGSFSSVGTNINTIILRVWADGRGNQRYYW